MPMGAMPNGRPCLFAEYACCKRPLADIAKDARAQGHRIECGPVSRDGSLAAGCAVDIVENHPRKAPARQAARIFC
jgi:hypothetical protein